MHSLAKVELHVHLQAALKPESIFELAERNGLDLPIDLHALKRRYDFTDLGSFLDL